MEMTTHRLALRLRRLKLLHFEVVAAIAEHGSLTAAALALGRSQPAVSQQLAEAEDALGVALFLRGRQIKATTYLPAVLRYMRRAINDSWQLKSELETLAHSGQSILRVGTMLVTGTSLVPDFIIGLREEAHAIQLELVEDIAAGLWARFERREIDLIVGRLDERAYAAHVRAEALYKDRHCVVVNNRHPLLKQADLSWGDTVALPWLLPPRDTALRRAIDATFLDLELRPPYPWVESAAPSVNLGLLTKTNCLSVMSRSAARQYVGLGVCAVLPLALKYDVGPVGMAWARDLEHPALFAVLDRLRLAARQQVEMLPDI